MKDPKTVFVISSDFCHWGQNFEYTPYDKSKGKIWESISAMDHEGARWIEKQDAEVRMNEVVYDQGFRDYIYETENTICGSNCIEIYLRALKASGLKTETELLKYAQSNQVVDMYDMSVSYCAIRTVLSSFIVC